MSNNNIVNNITLSLIKKYGEFLKIYILFKLLLEKQDIFQSMWAMCLKMYFAHVYLAQIDRKNFC